MMKNIFYKQRFLESPSLILTLCLTIIMASMSSMTANIILVLWGTLLLLGFSNLVIILTRYVPRSVHYVIIMLIITTIITLTYSLSRLLLPNTSLINLLVTALCSGLILMVAYMEAHYYHRSLSDSFTNVSGAVLFILSLSLLLLLSSYFTAHRQFIIEQPLHQLSDNVLSVPFLGSLSGRLILFSLILAMLRHFFRRAR